MKDFIQYPKGSEWRKWDLHVHTPASFHWNGMKFSNCNDEEKNELLEKMLKTINNCEVSVFTFVDYWTFEGYLMFNKYIDDNNLKLSKTVFPGMELRIEAPVDYRLNVQVILSDSLTKQELLDFKSQLYISSINRPLSKEAIINFAKTLDDSKAEHHGYVSPDKLNNDELFGLGCKTIEITRQSLKKAFNTIPSNMGFIMMPYDTSDGLEKLDWANHPSADNYFMQSTHIFETRKESNVDLFLGNKNDNNKDFIDNFQKTLGNKPKPACCGTDAHKFSKYGQFPSDKITWIRANPSFEGLKQIIFEPETRVKISQIKPKNKSNYQVVDKVRFLDDSHDNRFPDDWIELNSNLNVIIGGKSSGKSLLLYHIAKTIDSVQVIKKYNTTEIRGYDFEDESEFDFEVKWKDGRIDKLSDEKENIRSITYLPQMYINNLAEEDGDDDLNSLVLDILKQDDNFKKEYNNKQEEIKELNKDINLSIVNFFELREDIEEQYKNFKKLGDKEAIKAEIENINSEIEILRESSNFSEEENEKYNQIKDEQGKVEKEINNLEKIINNLTKFKSDTNIAMNNFIEKIENSYQELLINFEDNENVLEKIYNELYNSFKNNVEKITKKSFKPILEYKNELKTLKSKNEELKKDLKPYLAKFKNQNQLEKLQKNLNERKNELSNIIKEEKKINKNLDKEEKIKEEIISLYQERYESYKEIINYLKEENYVFENIELQASLKFKNDEFDNHFTDDINKKLTNLNDYEFYENYIYNYDKNNHLKNINDLFRKLLNKDNNNIKLKKNSTKRNALTSLLEDYFYINYDLIQNGDPIFHMSPGKRGLVLLQLFLHLSNSKHPILIDQPEDNLDNRTIYKELNEFIKNKKIERQIIIVTHNANLVVSTDAESVIVANQDGQEIGRDNKEYKFEYITGALECTFENKEKNGVLYKKGIKQHVCEILEGGKDAFKKREERYGFE